MQHSSWSIHQQKLWKGNIMSSRMMNHVKALQEEVGVLKDRIQPHDTGHIHTTISTLEERVQEINKQIEDTKLDEPIEAHDG